MLEVRFYPGDGLEHNELFQAYMTAKRYLYHSRRGKEIFDTLEDELGHRTVLHVDPSTDSTFQHGLSSPHFDAYWNPTIRLRLKPRGIQSPAVALIHELGHGLQCQTKLAWYEERSTGQRYLEIEDDNVATNETPVAAELGEPTRTAYQDNNGTQPFVGRATANLSFLQKVIAFQK